MLIVKYFTDKEEKSINSIDYIIEREMW
jgi:hypothetical protein